MFINKFSIELLTVCHPPPLFLSIYPNVSSWSSLNHYLLVCLSTLYIRLLIAYTSSMSRRSDQLDLSNYDSFINASLRSPFNIDVTLAKHKSPQFCYDYLTWGEHLLQKVRVTQRSTFYGSHQQVVNEAVENQLWPVPITFWGIWCLIIQTSKPPVKEH